LELRLQEGEANRDIFWLKDDTLEDSADLPDPDVSVKIMRKKCKADSLPCSYDRFDIPSMMA